MRVDKLLWFLRLAASRSSAQQWVLAGHIRVNGQRIVKPSAGVAVGDVLTLPMRTQVKVIVLDSLPTRRGSAAEAQTCYRALDGQAVHPIAALQTPATRGDPPP